MKKSIVAIALAAVAAVTIAGCTADPGSTSTPTASAHATAIPAQKVDKSLRDQLPASIKSAGSVVSINQGSFPPYQILDGNSKMTGATRDLETAVGQLLGITITDQTSSSLATTLTGMQGGRYQLAMGPIGDFAERHSQATFVDWVQEFVVFAVKKGNPEHIVDLDSACGHKIAVQAGGSAEQVIQNQSKTCASEGKPAITVQSYSDQPTSILAVQSGRADAFFSSQAPLTYFVQQSKGQLELAAVGKGNGFSDLFQGAIVPPSQTDLANVLLSAIKKLQSNGTYQAIMSKWGLQRNELKTPGINLGKSA